LWPGSQRFNGFVLEAKFGLLQIIIIFFDFSFTFYNKFDETKIFFLVNNLLCKKARFFPEFFGNCALNV
jgi:hypothetical protein